jgi:hypothetical protein
LRAIRRAAVLVLATLATAACGGSDGEDSSRRADCILAKENEARYIVVKDAYERGKLGSRQAVLAAMQPEARPAVFKADGDLRAWDRMGPAARNEFLQWATSGMVYEKTGDVQTRAVDGIDRSACD